MPIIIGILLLLLAIPGLTLLVWRPEHNSNGLWAGLLIIFIGSVLAGATLIIFGLQRCVAPGTMLYRIVHGRLL